MPARAREPPGRPAPSELLSLREQQRKKAPQKKLNEKINGVTEQLKGKPCGETATFATLVRVR
jgi:hypothetical protein